MKKYNNLFYINEGKYEIFRKKFKRDYIIEIDFSKFKSLNDFNKFLSSKIKAPEHYFGSLDRMFDLLVDFKDFDNSKKIIILIKNYSCLKNIDKFYYKDLLDLFNEAIKYHKENKDAELKVYLFKEDEK